MALEKHFTYHLRSVTLPLPLTWTCVSGPASLRAFWGTVCPGVTHQKVPDIIITQHAAIASTLEEGTKMTNTVPTAK